MNLIFFTQRVFKNVKKARFTDLFQSSSTQASSTITAVVSRTSAGVVEIFPPRYVHNPKKFLETLFNESE